MITEIGPVPAEKYSFEKNITTHFQLLLKEIISLLPDKLKEIVPPLNPNGFNAKKYYGLKRVRHELVLGADTRILNFSPFQPRGKLTMLTNKYLNAVDRCASTSSHGYLLKALFTGNKTDLPKELKRRFSKTGTMHLLAVSGLHIGILSFGVLWIIRSIPFRSRFFQFLGPITAAIVVWFFAGLCGNTPSVNRAALMFSFFHLGTLTGRPTIIWSSLTSAGFILLLIEPLQLQSVGFQLSFAAVAAIVFFQQRIENLLHPKNRIMLYAWKLTSVSLAANVGTAPLTIFYFYQFPIIFVLSNLFAIPIITLMMMIGFPALILISIFPSLKTVFTLCFDTLTNIMMATLDIAEAIPYGNVEGLWLSITGIFLCMALLISLSVYIAGRKKSMLYIALIIIGLLLMEWTRIQNLQTNQRVFIVYHNWKNFELDLFNGKNRLSVNENTGIASETAVVKTRLIRGAAKGQKLSLASNSNLKSLKILDQWLSINNVKMYYISGRFQGRSCWDALPLDILIIDKIYERQIPYIKDFFQPDMVLLTGRFRGSNRAVKESFPNSKVWDIRKQGAYIHHL